jgi:phosphatidate phosphatase LPIN
VIYVDRGGRRFISRKDSSPLLPALIVWRQSTLRAAVGATSEEEPLSSSDERDFLRPAVELQPAVKTSRSSWRLGWWRSRSAREVTTHVTGSKEPTSGTASSQRPGLQPASSAPDSMVGMFPMCTERRNSSEDDVQEVAPRRSTSPEAAKASTEPAAPSKVPSKHYVKTLRLTSDQLVSISPGLSSPSK